jgi:hypothetical protein
VQKVSQPQLALRHNNTPNAVLVGQVAHPISSLVASAGCMALAPHLRMVVWPCKFWPHLPKKYHVTINPTECLQIYTTTILVAEGNEAIMFNYFPVALTGTTQSWLMNLPPGSLYYWEELCHQFMTNFECLTLAPAMRLTSMSCSSARGSHYGTSSSGSPRLKTPFPASPVLLLLSHFERV